MDNNRIDSKFKNSYEEEYDALFEAIFGQSSRNLIDEIIDQRSNYVNAADEEEKTRLPEPLNDHGDDTTWSCLPDLLLEKIYSHLNMQQRYSASMVCRNWYEAFFLPNVWRHFNFDDKTLTRRLYNYHSGWQYMLDHLRTQYCLHHIGKHLRYLTFRPINNFHNLYELMNMISFYAENPQCNVKDTGAQICVLRYTFPCNMSSKNETKIYGTGGKLLHALKRLIGNLPSLRTLELVDLMLEPDEARHLLDQLCYSHCLLLKKLILINISKLPCPLLHAGVFLNLEELTITPHNLHDDVLELISHTKLRHLNIVQNTYTAETGMTYESCSSNAWKACRQRNPGLHVHLRIQSKKEQALVWQDSAPVYTISFDSPKIKATEDTITEAVRRYGRTLRVFGHLGLSRYYQSKSFQDRIDRHLVYLCENCPFLHTLSVREKISTTTLLLVSHVARNLRNFYVRKNAVILRSGWPPNLEWDDMVNESIKRACHSYSSTETEISSVMGYKWKMLSDKQFKNVQLSTKS